MEEIRLPQLGQTVEEASIVQWHKQEGEPVKQGELLFSVQTDKAEIECESTASGVLRKILLEPDREAPVLTVVALVGEADEPLPDLGPYLSAIRGAVLAEEVPAESRPPRQPVTSPASARARHAVPLHPSGKPPISPRARHQAHELGVDAAFAVPTGAASIDSGPRVTEEDVVAYAERARQVKATPTARRVAQKQGVDITRVTGTGPREKIVKEDVRKAAATPRATDGIRSIPLTPVRRIIAERMAESKASAPHYYVTMEVDATAAAAFRESTTSFKPSYNDLILFAVARALQRHPEVNARWAGDAIEISEDINLAFAVALPAGLVAPVIRRVQDKTLLEIHTEARALVDKARSGKLTPDDYAGSTFTVSNLGPFGVDYFTAIINPPNSAILAVGQIKDKPVAIEGSIQIRPMATLTLSSDHRVIDGAQAAQFMSALRQILESGEF